MLLCVCLSLCCLSLQHPTNHHRASHLSSCHICHHNNAGTSPLHLGTREIQLVYLKNALLLGVTFSYGSELVAVQAPPASGAGGWHAWAASGGSTVTSQTKGGALDFKPNKMDEYSKGIGQGKV